MADDDIPGLGDLFGQGYGNAVRSLFPGGANEAGVFKLGPLGAVPIRRRTAEEVADPTQTGWTFRDYRPINNYMGRGDWRRVEQTDSREVEVPIRRLYAGQKTVSPDFMSVPDRPVYGPGNPKATPFVIRKGGNMYLQDGHHRLTAAAQQGKQTARVRLVDLDNEVPPDAPLLDYLRALNEGR